MRSKLSVRLAFLFLVASLVPLIATAGIALRSMKVSLHEDAHRRHEEVAQLCSSLVELWMDSTADKLQALAEVMRVDLLERQAKPGDPVGDADLISLQNRIAPLIDTNREWTKQAIPALEVEFFQNDLAQQREPDQRKQQAAQEEVSYNFNVQNTQWIAANGSPEVREKVATRKGGRARSQLVQQPMQEGIMFCEPNIEVIDGTPTLAMAAPVGDVGCNFGSLVADLDFSELKELLEQLVGEGVSLRVADDLNTELFVLGTVEGALMSDRQEIGDTGWTVTVSEELARIEAPLGSIRQQTGLWIGIASLLAVLFSFALSTGITRPVRTLKRAAEAMEAGDLSARTGLSRMDEIGQLAASFDRMATALDHLDAAKSEFVGNVSHELRTPLTSMRLSVANLLDGVVGELDVQQKRTLTRIQRELDRMMKLVSELLEMARLEAGMVEPRREPVDLRELADSCVAAREVEAQRDSVTLAVSGKGVVHGDQSLIRRIVDNLLDNALKHSPTDGTVEIRIDARSIRVCDDGPGFPEGGAERMFEKFQQGQFQGVKNDGVGLGLAIVARLVRLLGARIEIENGPRSEGCERTGARVHVRFEESRA